jgi:hypothetical protein
MAKRKKEDAAGPIIGLAWYREGDWDFLLKVSADAEELEETYAEWVSLASARYAQAKATGMPIVKVDIDVHELVAWCRDRGCPVDANSRAEFAAHKTAEQHRGS